MKATSLITGKTNDGKLKRSAAKEISEANGLSDSETTINKLCEMVKVLVECHYELMDRLTLRHDQTNQKTIIAQPLPAEESALITIPGKLPVKKAEENEIMPLTYEKLKTLTKYFVESLWNAPRRTIGVHSHLNMLHTLYHLGGEAYAEQLFTSASVTNVSGYRYLSYLRHERLISFKGFRKEGIYQLTPVGRKFIEGEIKNKEQMQAALAGQKV